MFYSPPSLPSPALPEATVEPSPSIEATLAVQVSPTVSPTATLLPTSFIQPMIHEIPGEPYTSVFTYPIGENSQLQYITGDPTNGPNTFTVLPDGGFLIGDIDTDRLLHFSPKGQLLKIIDLNKLDIHAVLDMRVRNNQLYLVENNSYRVRRLTLDGELISTDAIPSEYKIDESTTIANGLWGIAIDCKENIILDIAGQLLHLSDVQNDQSLEIADKGYFCDGAQYRTRNVSTDALVQIKDDQGRETICHSTNSKGRAAALLILDVIPDGGVYLRRDDLKTIDGKIMVDETIHYLNPRSQEQAMARVPLLEFYTSPSHFASVSPEGEVYIMIPRATYLEVAQLNFYKQLEPLRAEYKPPNMICTFTP